MSKFVKASLVVLAVLMILGGAAFAWTQHRIGSSLEFAARELPPIADRIGDVSRVENIHLSEYAAHCAMDVCERYVSRVVGSKGALLMAADVAPQAADPDDEVSHIVLCEEDGALIDRMGDVGEIAGGLYCL
ncbi:MULTISPECIES: hypothetical protein [unclassified Dyella]|uniref:hypothetical protein n=1 Tax=unclassified Dyella TaxID=2634549 RepID=UPI003F92D543